MHLLTQCMNLYQSHKLLSLALVMSRIALVLPDSLYINWLPTFNPSWSTRLLREAIISHWASQYYLRPHSRFSTDIPVPDKCLLFRYRSTRYCFLPIGWPGLYQPSSCGHFSNILKSHFRPPWFKSHDFAIFSCLTTHLSWALLHAHSSHCGLWTKSDRHNIWGSCLFRGDVDNAVGRLFLLQNLPYSYRQLFHTVGLLYESIATACQYVFCLTV